MFEICYYVEKDCLILQRLMRNFRKEKKYEKDFNDSTNACGKYEYCFCSSSN